MRNTGAQSPAGSSEGLPEVPALAAGNLRRSALISIPLGVAAVALLGVLGHPLAGVLVWVGLALGALNSYLVQRSVVRYAAGGDGNPKRRFVGGVLARLAVITVIALGLCVLLLPDGLGVVGGLAAFQILMLVSASMPLIRELRQV